MAITYTLYEGAAAVAALSVGTLVAEFNDGENRSKRFLPINAPSGGTAASMVFPAIAAVSQVTDPQGNATGPVDLRLTPGLQDLINATSPMSYVLDADVSLTTASGTF